MKEESKKICQCGSECKLHKYTQFQYWFCPKCKIEVTTNALPEGFSALKGEKITTSCCNTEVGTLALDVPKTKKHRYGWMADFVTMYTGCPQCALNRGSFERRSSGWSPTDGNYEEISWFIKGRGWI